MYRYVISMALQMWYINVIHFVQFSDALIFYSNASIRRPTDDDISSSSTNHTSFHFIFRQFSQPIQMAVEHDVRAIVVVIIGIFATYNMYPFYDCKAQGLLYKDRCKYLMPISWFLFQFFHHFDAVELFQLAREFGIVGASSFSFWLRMLCEIRIGIEQPKWQFKLENERGWRRQQRRRHWWQWRWIEWCSYSALFSPLLARQMIFPKCKYAMILWKPILGPCHLMLIKTIQQSI